MDMISTKLLNKIHVPVIICNNSGKILHSNSLMNNIFCYTKVNNPKNICELDRNFDYEYFLKNEYVTRNILINKLHFNANISCLKNNDNSINIMYIFDNSITINKIVDDVINHIDEVVIIFNEFGVIEKMNYICDDILPFNRSEAIGKSIYEICKIGLVKNPIIIEMIKTKKKIYRNIKYPSGKVIAYTAAPFFYTNGDLKGGVLTGRDITRLIKLQFQINLDTHQPETTEYISTSKIMDNIKKMVIRAAASDSSIFINGESGVGKEIIARTIYNYSQRREKPFVAINCSAIPSELLESEFFGYEDGAFTGGKRGGKKGLLEEANGGTVFLDEIGELPLAMQSKLLRVIQENVCTRVGGTTSIHLDIRYISATNIPPDELHTNNKFRQDLYYRLNVIPVKIPPLRERKDDILPLITYFLDFYNKKYARKLKISSKALILLHEYDWPGNIRELKNMIERFTVLSFNDVITEDAVNIFMNLDTIEDNNFNNTPSVVINGYTNLNTVYNLVDQIMIPKAIKKYGSIVKASKELGINPSTIHRKIRNGSIKL